MSIFGGVDMSVTNFYGAGPIKPWQPGAKPGWYYGNFPWLFPWLPCLHGVRHRFIPYTYATSDAISAPTAHLHGASVVPLAHPVPEATTLAPASTSMAHVATPASSLAPATVLASRAPSPAEASRW